MSELQRTVRLGLSLAGATRQQAGAPQPPITRDDGQGFGQFAHWARLAEEGRFDFVCLGPVKLEPLTLASALATMTRHIGLVVTASTSLIHPFALARRLASIDHLSQGRAGWNLAIAATDGEKRNYGPAGTPEPVHRYEHAREFLAVVQGLFDGWEPGAFPRDRTTGIYMDPAKMHRLLHVGPYFKIRGPSDVDRPPQGALPIIMEAGSDGDQDFAAEVADLVFGAQPSIEAARAWRNTLQARRARHGRTAENLLVMPTMMPITSRTQAEAEDLFASMEGRLLADIGQSVPFALVGTPMRIADTMEEWFTTAAADGFVIQPATLAGGVEDFVHVVIPELQRRGLFRTEYEAPTLRGSLGMTPVAAWKDISARSVGYPAI